jgi:hypothetical protein
LGQWEKFLEAGGSDQKEETWFVVWTVLF